jgi:hypothetical protein
VGLSRDHLVERLIRAGELEISGGDQAENDTYFDTAQFRFHGPGGLERAILQASRKMLTGRSYSPPTRWWFLCGECRTILHELETLTLPDYGRVSRGFFRYYLDLGKRFITTNTMIPSAYNWEYPVPNSERPVGLAKKES